MSAYLALAVLFLSSVIGPPIPGERPKAAKATAVAGGESGTCPNVYIIETWANGLHRRTVACADGSCPIGNCDDTLRVRTTGTYPNDKTYPARISDRSTGGLEIELVPITGGE